MKKILLVADEPGWIFERHCQEIKKRLTEYIIDIAFHRQNIPEISKNYDLVYVLDPMPMNYPPADKTIIGLRCEFLIHEHPQGAKGLYEMGFLGRCVSIKDKCCIFHVVNRNQMSFFRDIVTDKPLIMVQHGIDEEVFNRSKYLDKSCNDVLTVGMSGRDSRNKIFGVVREACAKMNVKFLTAQYHNRLSKEEMPTFYRQLDVYVCMSETEGLHNGTMEAGAMGVPVISTRCGAVEEMIQDGKSGLLIERNIGSLCKAIDMMKRSREYRCSLSDEFYSEIMRKWTWKIRIEDFRKMFQSYFLKA